MKKHLSLLLLLVFAFVGAYASIHKSVSKSKKKVLRKPTYSEEYTGSMLKVADLKTDKPTSAGFMYAGHYKMTVLETVAPIIRVSGTAQPRVHICVESTDTRKPIKAQCIGELANGYANMFWEARATTKSVIVAYRADGTRIPVAKEQLSAKPIWKGNIFTWQDGDYKVRIKITKCKVEPNGLCICN
jgi:hypothetical protein